MKIIILGAGQVGGTLAENLAGENNDITIVDTDSERLRELQDKFDLRVVNGHGAHPKVLREAIAHWMVRDSVLAYCSPDGPGFVFASCVSCQASSFANAANAVRISCSSP